MARISDEQLRNLIARHFGDLGNDVTRLMYEIARRESSFNSQVIHNSAFPDRPNYRPPAPGALPEYSVGLFQINIGPGGNTDLGQMNLRDPEQNIKAARTIFDRQGPTAWSVFPAAAQAAGYQTAPRQERQLRTPKQILDELRRIGNDSDQLDAFINTLTPQEIAAWTGSKEHADWRLRDNADSQGVGQASAVILGTAAAASAATAWGFSKLYFVSDLAGAVLGVGAAAALTSRIKTKPEEGDLDALADISDAAAQDDELMDPLDIFDEYMESQGFGITEDGRYWRPDLPEPISLDQIMAGDIPEDVNRALRGLPPKEERYITRSDGSTYRINPDGSVDQLIGEIDPDLQLQVDREGNLWGIHPQTGQRQLIHEGFDHASVDPEREQARRERETELSAQDRELERSRLTGFVDGDPTLERELGVGRLDLDRDRLGLDVRGQDFFETQEFPHARDIDLRQATRLEQDVGSQIETRARERALAEQQEMARLLSSPTDFLARAFLQRGGESPLPQVTQADLLNMLGQRVSDSIGQNPFAAGAPFDSSLNPQPRLGAPGVPAPPPQAPAPAPEPDSRLSGFVPSPGIPATGMGGNQVTSADRDALATHLGSNLTPDIQRQLDEFAAIDAAQQARRMEDGGVTNSRLAVVGEAGPELVVNMPEIDGFAVLNQEQLGFNPEKLAESKGKKGMPSRLSVPGAATGGVFKAGDAGFDLSNPAFIQQLAGQTNETGAAARTYLSQIEQPPAPTASPPPAPVAPAPTFAPTVRLQPQVQPQAAQASPPQVTQAQLQQQAADFSPPAVNSLLAGEPITPMRSRFRQFTPGQLAALTPDEQLALNTRLAAHNETLEDYTHRMGRLFGPTRSSRRGRLIV